DNLGQLVQEPKQIISLNSNNFDDDEIDIGQILSIIKRRGSVIIGTTITLAGLLSSWILVKPPVYQGTFQLLVEPLNKNNQQLDALTQIVPQNNWRDSGLDYESQINVLTSPVVINPILENIKIRYPDIEIDDIAGRIEIKQSGQTKIIDIAYTDESEEKILFVLKQLMEGYLNYQSDELTTSVRQAQVFVDEQIKRVQQDVFILESQLESFQQTNNLIDPNTENSVLAGQSKFLLEQVESVQNELKAKTQLAQDLKNQLDLTPEQGVIVSRLNQEKNYAKLISQIKDIESKIALETIKLGSQHPTLTTLTAQKEELITLLNQETQQILGYRSANLSLDFLTSVSNNTEMIQKFLNTNNEVEALKAKERGLQESWEKLNQQINRLSTTNKEYYQIQRELRTNNESLTRLLALKENLQIEVAKQTAPWKLLTPINEDLIEDVSGRTRKIALIIIASLFVGVSVGFLIDKLDSVFHSVEELQNTIELPCLG
ncbi:GumC family protein, partial [Geminocystis sp. CENA526]|uniref:GumC family protein n=1 Tax=Geminocystis sp. CENA526 TaxID=1355871 RepID=UPI003D6E1680